MNTLIVWTAEYLIYAVALGLAIYWLAQPSTRKRSLAILGATSGLIAFILTKLAGLAYYDPRPFVVEHSAPLFAHDPDNGFPSDHTVLLTVVAISILYYSRPVGSLFLIAAICVGIARILARVHSPIDIVASVILGIASVVLARLVLRKSKVIPND